MTTLAPPIEIEIDLNVRVGMNGHLTFSGFDDITIFGPGGEVHPGMSVLAVEPESGLAAPAIVVAVNYPAMLVYLCVAWREMKPRAEFPC